MLESSSARQHCVLSYFSLIAVSFPYHCHGESHKERTATIEPGCNKVVSNGSNSSIPKF